MKGVGVHKCSAKNRVPAIGIYSLNVQRAVVEALAIHAGQSVKFSLQAFQLYMYMIHVRVACRIVYT